MIPTAACRRLSLTASFPSKVPSRQLVVVVAATRRRYECHHLQRHEGDDDDKRSHTTSGSSRRRKRGQAWTPETHHHATRCFSTNLHKSSEPQNFIMDHSASSLSSQPSPEPSPEPSPSPPSSVEDGNKKNNNSSPTDDDVGDTTVSSLLEDLERAAKWNHGQEGKMYDKTLWEIDFCQKTAGAYDSFLTKLSKETAARTPLDSTDKRLDLLSSETVILAFKVLIKCHYEPEVLAMRVREWERCLGKLKKTPLTDHLSLRLLTANGKSGNVGRVLSLLQLRKSQGYRPRQREFIYAITSLQAASLPQVRSRNIYLSDRDQPAIDNPTRWLDAILLNMADRDFKLTTFMANRMLDCYSAGRTGKAVHSFYRVTRRGIKGLPEEDQPVDASTMPKDWYYLPESGFTMQPIKVKLKYNRGAPPFYKVPAQVKGKLLYRPDSPEEGKLKVEREMEPEYSLPLAAAFSFAESLQHGACGHDAIELNVYSYNALIKACVYRGALWRAMHVLETTMPAAVNCAPDTVSYNLILSGLATVGDVVTAQEYYVKMQNAGLEPDAFTVRAIVDGLLNVGDMPGAVTVVQDFFNQHSILPPYTTHTKVLEFCLARDMVYEAKRYIYFIQQLWRWEPSSYDKEDFVKLMRATQRNTQLQKPALQKLFAYFGEELTEADFLPC